MAVCDSSMWLWLCVHVGCDERSEHESKSESHLRLIDTTYIPPTTYHTSLLINLPTTSLSLSLLYCRILLSFHIEQDDDP